MCQLRIQHAQQYPGRGPHPANRGGCSWTSKRLPGSTPGSVIYGLCRHDGFCHALACGHSPCSSIAQVTHSCPARACKLQVLLLPQVQLLIRQGMWCSAVA